MTRLTRAAAVLAHGHAGGSSVRVQLARKAVSPAPVRQPLLGVLVLVAAGCSSYGPMRRRPPDPRYVQPTIAVLRFDNRVAGRAGWKIGDGIADMLVHALVCTGRYSVVERRELGSVFDEIKTQHTPGFRPQGRATVGRLKNVTYLIKGTITDFGHVSDHRLGFWHELLSLRKGGSTAVLGMTLYVIDVESGEVLASEAIDERVRAGDVAGEGVYKNVTFGGTVFHRTPLGRATRSAIRTAVDRISTTIARQRWRPKVAGVESNALIITGGRDRRLAVGATFQVMQRGEAVIDPDTGDVIGTREPNVVGVVVVEKVNAKFSIARILSGRGFQVGQTLRPTVLSPS